VSPITGEEEAALSGQLYAFPRDEKNMSRWREWWRRANLEQVLSFALVAIVSITAFSLVAYSTVFGNPDLPDESNFDFISLQADQLDVQVGDWFGTLFLAIGTVSLFAAALGIVDYVSRLVADVIRCGYTEGSGRWTESRLYFAVVWTMVIVGSGILLAGFDQPLVLVTISTVLGGFIMFVYSSLLVVTNRRYLPSDLKLRGYRLAIMVFAILLLGTTSVIVGIDQFGNLF
jgi:Mn2+/Fe2+ NRAMP family transporter